MGILSKLLGKVDNRSYSERLLEKMTLENYWLFDALFNDLYKDHPELWGSWIKPKLEEHKARFRG